MTLTKAAPWWLQTACGQRAVRPCSERLRRGLTATYLCRGVVPVSDIPQELYSQSVTMWGGPELDFFHYPLRRDEIFNIGASYRDPSVEVGEGYPQGNRDVMLERFRDACPHVRRLLEHIDVSRAWILYDRPPIKEWTKGRVTLLGDAAHPTYIYISQGGCMALEDAVVLAEMVDRHPRIEDAFREYQDARYLRTARIQLTSRQFGEIYHAVGVHRDLRNLLLKDAQPSALFDTLAWVFGAGLVRPDTGRGTIMPFRWLHGRIHNLRRRCMSKLAHAIDI